MVFVICCFSMLTLKITVPNVLVDEHDEDGIYDLLPQHAEAEDRAASKRGEPISLSKIV